MGFLYGLSLGIQEQIGSLFNQQNLVATLSTDWFQEQIGSKINKQNSVPINQTKTSDF